MTQFLTNYSNLPVPDVGDPRSTGAAEVTEAFVAGLNPHDHGANGGVPINAGDLVVTTPFDLQGLDIINIGNAVFVDSPVTPQNNGLRRIGDDIIYRTSAGTDLILSSQAAVDALTQRLDDASVVAWMRYAVAAGPTFNITAQFGFLGTPVVLGSAWVFTFVTPRPSLYVLAGSVQNGLAQADRFYSIGAETVNTFQLFLFDVGVGAVIAPAAQIGLEGAIAIIGAS